MDKVIIRNQYSTGSDMNNTCIVRNGRVHWTSEHRGWQMAKAAQTAGYTSQTETNNCTICGMIVGTIVVTTWTK